MTIERLLADLKAKIPIADHPALESRFHALLNDPEVDDGDIVQILREEFDPAD